MADDEEERYLSTEEIAEHYSVAAITIYRLANAGRIPYIRVGRTYRFRLSEVDAAFKAETDQAAAEA